MGKKNDPGKSKEKKNNATAPSQKLPHGHKVYLKKDENGNRQFGVLTEFTHPTIKVYFPETKQTRYYNFYNAFLQEEPLFETKDRGLLKRISRRQKTAVCSECKKTTENLTASGRFLLCQDCIKHYFVCEKCNALTKIVYDYYDLPTRKFFLICPICLRYYTKRDSYDFVKVEGLFEWYELPVEFRTASLLMQYGYTVDARVGLTQGERRCLLYSIVRNGFLSKGEILKHLNRNIDMIGKQKNRESAVQKWKADIDYVKTLNPPYKRPI